MAFVGEKSVVGSGEIRVNFPARGHRVPVRSNFSSRGEGGCIGQVWILSSVGKIFIRFYPVVPFLARNRHRARARLGGGGVPFVVEGNERKIRLARNKVGVNKIARENKSNKKATAADLIWKNESTDIEDPFLLFFVSQSREKWEAGFVRLVNEFHSNEEAILVSIFFFFRIRSQCLATNSCFLETSKSKLKSPVKIGGAQLYSV